MPVFFQEQDRSPTNLQRHPHQSSANIHCMMRQNQSIAIPTLSLLLALAATLTAHAQSTAPDDFPQLQHIDVSSQCQVLSPDTGEWQSNPDVCHLEGMGVYHSSHVAAKEVDGAVQHTNVNVAEQTYLLQNIHADPVVFVIEEQVPDGWHIDSDPQPKSMNDNYAIFEAIAQPGQIVRLHTGMAHETPMDDPR
jgi:hypothetical protein